MPRQCREIPWLDTREGVYYVFWYNKETRRTDRFSLRTSSSEEAQAAYAAFLTKGRGLYEPAGDDLSVTAAVDQYLREHKAADQRRQEGIGEHLRRHFGATAMRLVDIAACRRYADARRAEGVQRYGKTIRPAVSDPTIRRELVMLRAAAHHAIKWRRLAAAHAPQIDLPADSDARIEFYSREELARVLDCPDEHLRRFLRVLYYTGSRRKAVERLEIDQIDFSAGTIALAKPGERKTKKRRPTVPIFGEIKDDLVALVAEARSAGRTRLFTRHDYYRPYYAHCDALGLGHKGNPHVMRHTRATLALMNDEPIHKVAKLLGDTVATIEKTYMHLLPNYIGTLDDGMDPGALRTNGGRKSRETQPTPDASTPGFQWLE